MKNFRSSVRRGAGLGSILAMLGGCAAGPNFVRPAAPDTDRYTHEAQPEATVAADGQAQHFRPGTEIPADWWRLFQSMQLDAVVQQAISNNPTLQAAEASLRQSQDNLRAGYGLYFPQGQAGVSASRQLTAPLQQGSHTSGSIFNLFTASGSISYTLDVFGGKRRTVEGLRAQADSQRYESKAAYLVLSANVVNTSIARAAYTAQIRATEQMIDLENQQLHLAETQARAGTAPYSAVLSVRSLIAANQALLAPLKQNVSQAEHLLATLEGVVPAKAILPDIDVTELSLPVDMPVSLPSDLVNQRPDILSAEAQMHVASANIGIATAAMFPSFSLSGTYGGASTTLANLSAVSKFWSIGPTAATPVFQGNSLWYVRRASIDAYQQSQATYRQTVLGAFEQVADSLKALEHDAEGLQAQVEAQHAASEALNLLQVNYRAGLVAYPDVLTADVQFHQATIGYLQAFAQRHQDTVALFVALGGGWWNGQPPVAKKEAP
ncbi:MAG: efflux transporter outer membrane subunit [Verrucomicrobiota bacterium]|jgi:NodT family efflux transporter outer membrane factor (OMF) lipoprotein